MAKEKDKKSKIGIKTSRYFTKKCTACGSDYPNWFTHCPQCGLEWSAKSIKSQLEKPAEELKKTIKIVVKITEEDFEQKINYIELIFSGDQGKSWYKMKMSPEEDYYVAEMEDVPQGSVIIYYIEVYLANGENYIENNNGNYFYYKVGVPIEESLDLAPQLEAEAIQSNIKSSTFTPQEYSEIHKSSKNIKSELNKSDSIFDFPQTELDTNLKICPHCNSKIKNMWSTCPFCGNKV